MQFPSLQLPISHIKYLQYYDHVYYPELFFLLRLSSFSCESFSFSTNTSSSVPLTLPPPPWPVLHSKSWIAPVLFHSDSFPPILSATIATPLGLLFLQRKRRLLATTDCRWPALAVSEIKRAPHSAFLSFCLSSATPSLKHLPHLLSGIPHWAEFFPVPLIPSMFHSLIPPLSVFPSKGLECPKAHLCALFIAFLR